MEMRCTVNRWIIILEGRKEEVWMILRYEISNVVHRFLQLTTIIRHPTIPRWEQSMDMNQKIAASQSESNFHFWHDNSCSCRTIQDVAEFLTSP